MKKPEDGMIETPEEIIDAVKEDPNLMPVEKETNILFSKRDDYIRIYTEEGGLMRRLLKHPEFGAVEFRVNRDGDSGYRESPDTYSKGTVTGVKGYGPIGILKLSARSRSTSQHATVVSKKVSELWVEMIGNDDSETEIEPDVKNRLQKAEEFQWGNEFAALKEGRYDDTGFGSDREEAEKRLVEILGWLFDDDLERVHQVMDYICEETPTTNVGTRLWLEKDEEYREEVLESECQHTSTYNPPQGKGSNRPKVSKVTWDKVYHTLLSLGIASSETIANHEDVDRDQRQVQRALKEGYDEGFLKHVRDGRKVLYYHSKELVPENLREKYDLE